MNLSKEAMKLASEDVIPFTKEGFSLCSPIYIATTSHVKNTLDLYEGYRDVLSVCGTGAHAFEALLRGAKHVDLFDINQLQLVYFLFMKTAITILPYEDFVLYFSSKIDEEDEIDDKYLLAGDVYLKLEEYLPDFVKSVLGPIYKKFSNVDILDSRLVRYNHNFTLPYLQSVASFYSEEEYYKLQNILRSNPEIISIYPYSLEEVPSKFSGCYDLILLDNVLEYYSSMRGLNSPDKVDSFIKSELSSLLRPDGNIQTTYSYGFDTDYFMRKLGLSDESTDDFFEDEFLGAIPMSSFLGDLFSKEVGNLEAENLAVPLYTDYEGYEYSVFSGADITDGDNMVLTYSKKN